MKGSIIGIKSMNINEFEIWMKSMKDNDDKCMMFRNEENDSVLIKRIKKEDIKTPQDFVREVSNTIGYPESEVKHFIKHFLPKEGDSD